MLPGMGSGCTKCRGKLQDWCRDTCGCCPCACCKTIKVEVNSQQTTEQKIEKKSIPSGHAVLHAGIRTKDNTYTSPVLEVQTWRKSMIQRTTNEMTLSQRVALGGMQTDRDNADRHLGLTRGAADRQLEIDEEIIIIPVESIISIKYTSEIKKAHTEFRHLLSEKPEHVHVSCCEKISQWCSKTFCCCCNDSDRRVHNRPEQIITKISNEKAERKMLITIEFIRYSNIHTPSHIRVLSAPDQAAFYKETLQREILRFYILDNDDFEQGDFDLKRMQASILCRLVTQLKAMIGHYPDEPTMEAIIGSHSTLAIGDPPKENLERLAGSGEVDTSQTAVIPFPRIDYKP